MLHTGPQKVKSLHWSLVHKRFLFTVTWETLDVETGDGRWPWRLMAQRFATVSSLLNTTGNLGTQQLGNTFLLYFRKHSTTILSFGATETPIILQEARLALTCKRPSYQPTGTHPSPRSVLEWRSANSSSSSPWTSRPSLCTHWLLMGNTAKPHWAVTCGSLWLAPQPHYRLSVIKKGLIMLGLTNLLLEQESVFLETTRKIASLVIPELVLELEGEWMIPTHVETMLSRVIRQIMVPKTSKPWDIS